VGPGNLRLRTLTRARLMLHIAGFRARVHVDLLGGKRTRSGQELGR
jgi:hypothetical protein